MFFIIALFSTIVALNKVESIIELSRSIILISSIWVFYDCLKKSKTPFVKLSFKNGTNSSVTSGMNSLGGPGSMNICLLLYSI